MPANIDSPSKHRPRPPAARDRVAPAMVHDWDPGQRRRIRDILMILAFARPELDLSLTPEMRVVAMIDREESACRQR